MDWTTFEGFPLHHGQPAVDVRREIIRSIKATAAFLAALSIAAIILAAQISRGPAGATTECLPPEASSVPFSSEAGITDNCRARWRGRDKSIALDNAMSAAMDVGARIIWTGGSPVVFCVFAAQPGAMTGLEIPAAFLRDSRSVPAPERPVHVGP